MLLAEATWWPKVGDRVTACFGGKQAVWRHFEHEAEAKALLLTAGMVVAVAMEVKSERFAYGDRVEANFKGQGRYFAGKISH
jgi:hypothetical protein